MAIKSVLENLDGVDEALKSFYVEHDGKFHLDLDDNVRDHRDVLALRKAYDAEKEGAKAAKAEAKKAKDDLAEALKGKPDEAALVAERQRLEKERDDAIAERDTARNQITGITRDNALSSALAEVGVTDPGLQKGATAMLRDQIKMVDGKPMVETDMGPKALADHVKQWAASEGKSFVTPPAGGGAKGADKGGAKPFAEMTEAERVALHRTNPAEYQRLRATG